MEPQAASTTRSTAPAAVCEIALESLKHTVVDLTASATPQRYRLLDCIQFTRNRILRICEYSDFPHVPYSAVSYVWRGNPEPPPDVVPAILRGTSMDPSLKAAEEEYGTFVVKGAEDGDPISIDVLEHACIASLKKGAEYLWLDRLCILQNSREDKSWQIARMYRIYKDCSLCIILPGGVRRLAYMREETHWIHRAWTLQEVLAPPSAVVLFSWTLGSGEIISGDEWGTIEEVVARKSAMSDVANIINGCVAGTMDFQGSSSRRIRARIFGSASPNLAALGIAMSQALSDDPDAVHHAIWQSALMRTSSRPVDMVFSIMGLFGVILDVGSFHKDERLRATVSLAREILRHGGRASWLGVSVKLPPCRQLSTFPEFPQTSVAGKALVRIDDEPREVADFMDGEYPNSLGLRMSMPNGSMDDAGYLTFSRKAAHVVPAINHHSARSARFHEGYSPDSEVVFARTKDGTVFRLCNVISPAHAENGPGSRPRAFAILISWFQEFWPGATPAGNTRYIRVMMVEEHAPEKFHVTSFVSLDKKYRDWVLGWEERGFSVGGPDSVYMS